MKDISQHIMIKDRIFVYLRGMLYGILIVCMSIPVMAAEDDYTPTTLKEMVDEWNERNNYQIPEQKVCSTADEYVQYLKEIGQDAPLEKLCFKVNCTESLISELKANDSALLHQLEMEAGCVDPHYNPPSPTCINYRNTYFTNDFVHLNTWDDYTDMLERAVSTRPGVIYFTYSDSIRSMIEDERRNYYKDDVYTAIADEYQLPVSNWITLYFTGCEKIELYFEDNFSEDQMEYHEEESALIGESLTEPEIAPEVMTQPEPEIVPEVTAEPEFETAQEPSDVFPLYYGRYGSAKRISGTTVIISIFADDMFNYWDFNSDYDLYQRSVILQRMQIGLSWLSQQTARYGAYSEFIYDYSAYADLYYTHVFSEDLINGSDSYRAISEYINSSIDVEAVMRAHMADNVVFFVHLNAPSSDDYRSFTYDGSWSNLNNDQYFFDTCVFVPYGHGVENTPAVYAHEFMHCFGAVDLYLSGNQITQEYVDYLYNMSDFDVMRQCYWSAYDQVTNDFSDVDAYYMGLISSCQDVDNFGLGRSCYFDN